MAKNKNHECPVDKETHRGYDGVWFQRCACLVANARFHVAFCMSGLGLSHGKLGACELPLSPSTRQGRRGKVLTLDLNKATT